MDGKEASTIVLNPIDHEGNDQSNWISSIRIGDIVTIRQRGNPNNYGMYKINTVWTELPISVEPVVAGIEYITHDNKGAPQATPGISATTDGYVVAPLPATTINGEVIDAVNFDVEYEISFVPSGQQGSQGPQGSQVLKVFRVLKVLKVRQDLMEMVEKEMQVLHFFLI